MNALLKDKTAIVTGGTAGIGKAIAKRFLEQGAKVAIFGSNPERGATAEAELKAYATDGADLRFYQVDVADRSQVDAAIEKVEAELGSVGVLVNNAGITRDGLLLRMKEDDWDRVMDVNLKSCFNTCQSLYRSFTKARAGKIINVTSVVGITGNPGQTNYAASKGGVISFTKSLAKELARRNVCVNCIAPGFVETPMTDKLTDKQREETLAHIPMGRHGKPEEIANAALFLASEMSDYVTGQVLTVDGGMV